MCASPRTGAGARKQSTDLRWWCGTRCNFRIASLEIICFVVFRRSITNSLTDTSTDRVEDSSSSMSTVKIIPAQDHTRFGPSRSSPFATAFRKVQAGCCMGIVPQHSDQVVKIYSKPARGAEFPNDQNIQKHKETCGSLLVVVNWSQVFRTSSKDLVILFAYRTCCSGENAITVFSLVFGCISTEINQLPWRQLMRIQNTATSRCWRYS